MRYIKLFEDMNYFLTFISIPKFSFILSRMTYLKYIRNTFEQIRSLQFKVSKRLNSVGFCVTPIDT